MDWSDGHGRENGAQRAEETAVAQGNLGCRRPRVLAQGFKETSVADIMNAADLGIGTFYNYFESKEEILMCLLGRLVDEVDEALTGMRAARRPL